VFKLTLSLLLGGPVLAWWPGRMPAAVRKVATCLALAPVVLVLVFTAHVVFTRPAQLLWPAGLFLPVLGMTVVAGAYAMWPGAAPRRNRVIAAVLFVGPLLGLLTLAGAFLYVRAGTVVGKVTFKGQPLPSGKVTILSADGVVCSGDIGPNGRYTVYRVPPGPARIAVAAYPPPPPGPVPVAVPKYIPIPRRYRDFDRSGLTCPVTRGGQVRDLELQP
jgi:hypothetical protein